MKHPNNIIHSKPKEVSWTQKHFELLFYPDTLDILTKIEYIPIFITSLLNISPNIQKEQKEIKTAI